MASPRRTSVPEIFDQVPRLSAKVTRELERLFRGTDFEIPSGGLGSTDAHHRLQKRSADR